MNSKTLTFGLLALAAATTSWGQRVTDRRSAEIRGGGGDGKCTIEVVVDDVAEVEILGMNANIRTLSGGPATFRRFQCNQEMPMRPNNFRFEGVDGRGRQNLVRSAGSGGPAIIRIEDSKGGTEGYTFDIFWQGGSGGGRFGGGGGGGGFGGGNAGGGGWGGGNGWGSGSGWGNAGDVNFSGRGNGGYRDRSGKTGRLYNPVVIVTRDGSVNVRFDSDQGSLNLRGRVDRRDRGRIFANVSGDQVRGMIEIEMNSGDSVRRIYMRDDGPRRYELNWPD